MKKFIVSLILLVACGVAVAQETHIRDNADRQFYEGRTLFEQRKFAAATKCFEAFCEEAENKNSTLVAEAEYYIAAAAYRLKTKNAQAVLLEYAEKFPASAMHEQVAYMIGRLYFEQKKYAETIKWYEKVQNQHLEGSDNMAYLYTKAFAYLKLEQFEPARVLFATLNGKKSIYEKDALYYYSYTEYCAKNYNAAINGFLELSINSPYAEPAAFHALQIYDRVGDTEKACEYGKTLVSRWPNSKYSCEAYRILGENAYYSGDYAAAVDYLKKYERSEKKVQRADMYMLGIASYRREDWRTTVSALSKVTTVSDSLSQNAYLHIGLSYARLGDKTKARMAFQTASNEGFDKKITEEADYNYVLAVYEGAAPFGESVKAFEGFLEKYPKTKHLDDIYSHLADIYIAEKDYKTAYESLKKIKISNPKIKAARENAAFQLGVTEFAAKKYKEAIDYFTLAINEFSAASTSAQAFLWRGETYFRLGENAKSRADLQKFLAQKQTKSAEELRKTNYTMAYSFYNEQNFADAIAWFKKVDVDKKGIPTRMASDVLNRLGDCYFYSRNWSEASNTYRHSIAKAPRYGDYATYQNAVILGVQKNYSAKIDVLEQLLKDFPRSDYADDASYEIGRSYVLTEQNEQAVVAYNRVLAQFPHMALARKAALEIGMIYATTNQNDKAIAAYKEVVNKYPSSEEAKVAIESMQAIYVDNNQINDYIAYRESIAGSAISTVQKTLEDSLNFVAAERQFAKENYKEAIASFKNYLENYCDNQTINCISAQYYLAEGYYKTGLKETALEYFERLTRLTGNPYEEEAVLRCAEVTFDQKDYEKSLTFFEQLHETAGNKENKKVARLGMLRCGFALNLNNKTILAANDLLDDAAADATLEREARYCRAKAYIAADEELLATEDLQILSQDLRHEMGAEAKYLYADQLFRREQTTQAEAEIMDFISQNTPHQYWLARAFVLLADIYVKGGDDFQAKQYLLSLQANYTANDDISTLIEIRLHDIEQRETASVNE